MSTEDTTEFVYVTHIMTTPEKLWAALTQSEFTTHYFFGNAIESNFQVGSPIVFMRDGNSDVQGTVLESDPPRRLSFTWLVTHSDETRAQGESRVTFDLLPMGNTVRLTLTHDRLLPEQLQKEYPGKHAFYGFRNGWPAILSSMKSLLETGQAIKYDF